MALFALVAVAFAAPNPKPQVVASVYSAPYGYAAEVPYAAGVPYAYSAPAVYPAAGIPAAYSYY